jgi:hypothetical protein
MVTVNVGIHSDSIRVLELIRFTVDAAGKFGEQLPYDVHAVLTVN